MNCKKIRGLILTDYADGNLRAEAMQEVESHIASCADCREIAGKIALAGKVFKAAGREEPPPGIWHKIKAGITAGRDRPSLADRVLDVMQYSFLRLRPAVVIATAAVLIFFVLITARLMPGKGTIPPVADQDDILTLSVAEDGWNGDEYNLGTQVEEYFL